MEDKQKSLYEMETFECSCNKCRSMCHRPCFGTPKDIQALIDAGYGDRLTLDTHCGINEDANIFILTPALKDHEGKASPYLPYSKKGCTFWKYGKCQLHKSGLKPIGGKLALHNNIYDDQKGGGHTGLGAEIVETRNSDEGRALVESWCAKHGVEVKEPVPSLADAIELHAIKAVLNNSRQ